MNLILVETFMVVMIISYIMMGIIFIAGQKNGKSFVACFDKALLWGGCVFVIGYSLDLVAYAAMP